MKIIKYNEFFDTEDIKMAHEIDTLSNSLTKYSIIKKFNRQDPFQSVFGILVYKFKFLKEVTTPSPYAFLAESQIGQKMYVINFKNEQAKIAIGINILENKRYNIHLIYMPVDIDINNESNWLIIEGELEGGIKRNKIVDQGFMNLDLNGIIKKIDKIFIPIMKEFGFHTLLSSYISDHDIEKN